MVTITAARRWGMVAALLAAGVPGAAAADAFDDLVAAERAFAADAAARSVRDAFLTAMGEDGVVFAPGPVNARRHWTPRAADAAKLEWAPEAAEVAASGDLGYTYGPWRFTPPGGDAPLAFGHYFTVWRRQADGTWRALADKGITHAGQPLPTNTVRRGQLAVAGAARPGVTPLALAELRQADLLPVGRITAERIAPDFVRFRNAALPQAASESPALEPGPTLRFDSAAVMSAAGDLAATWGGSATGGSWLRVWRRAGVGDPPGAPWRLVADVSDVAPPAPADDE